MDWIHDRIHSGQLHVGDKIETEAEISQRFGFSRQTVRQALGSLEMEGTITRIQGSGSYVKTAAVSDPGAPLSRSVTIISSYTDSYIFPRILRPMAEVLQAEGYSTRISFTSNHRETERQILLDLLRSDSRDPVAAEPVTSALPSLNLDLYRELIRRGIPVLFFNSYYPGLDIPHVSMDDRGAGRRATDYLISLGHERIGCIMKNDDGQGILRYQGYQQALSDAGISLMEKRVCWIDTGDMKDMLEGGEWILRRLRDCSAVVCYNDEVAYMLTQMCQDTNIRIPEQLSIVSIDNSRLTELNPVPLTSIAHPMEELGEKTARNLLELIKDPAFDATYDFEGKLIVRKSAAQYDPENVVIKR